MVERVGGSPEKIRLAGDFNQAIQTIEVKSQGSDFSPFGGVNLLGGDKDAPDYEDNRARRDLAIETTVEIMEKWLHFEGNTDQIKFLAIRELARKYLQTSGLRTLQEMYLDVQYDDPGRTAEHLGKIYSFLKGKLDSLTADRVFVGQSVVDSTSDAMAADITRVLAEPANDEPRGMSLDAETRRMLGYSQVDPARSASEAKTPQVHGSFGGGVGHGWQGNAEKRARQPKADSPLKRKRTGEGSA